MKRVCGLFFGLLPALALAMVAAPVARADEAPAKPAHAVKGQRIHKAVQECLDKLGLTAQQKSDIAKLNKDTAAKRKAIMQSDKSKEEKAKAMKELMSDRRAAMGKILTQDQQKALQECLKEQRAKHGKAADGKRERRNKADGNAKTPGDAPA